MNVLWLRPPRTGGLSAGCSRTLPNADEHCYMSLRPACQIIIYTYYLVTGTSYTVEEYAVCFPAAFLSGRLRSTTQHINFRHRRLVMQLGTWILYKQREGDDEIMDEHPAIQPLPAVLRPLVRLVRVMATVIRIVPLLSALARKHVRQHAVKGHPYRDPRHTL